MTTQKRTVIYVSDGTGITAETLGHGLLAQFEGIEFKPLRFPFVDNEDKVRECLARIGELGQREVLRPIVIMTLTNPDLSRILHQADAFFIDLFDAFIVPLEQELGCRYSRAMGRSHGHANPEYNSRIAAVNFALAHDDGAIPGNVIGDATEVTAGQITEWLAMRGYRLTVQAVVKARAALMDAKRGPVVTCPAVFLPDNGNWHTGDPVEIRALVVCLACQEGRHALCYGGTCECGCEDRELTDG